MRAIILCGGVGSRMHPLTGDKFTLVFLGKPLLQHVVEGLREAGADEIVFVANAANHEMVSKTALKYRGVACHVVRQKVHTGMAGAVEAAVDYLSGPVLIVSSNDVVAQTAYRAVIFAANDIALDAAILACRVEDYFPGGYLVADPDMSVSHIAENPGPGSEPSDLVNVVAHYHRDGQRLFDAVRAARSDKDDRYEVALASLVADGYRVRAVPYAEFWGPMKRPWDVFPVMSHFLSGISPSVASSVVVAPSAIIEGNVVLADGVRVLEHAVIRGPAYIGERSVIGNNALIRGGVHIGARCVVGFSTEVKHSYIGDDCSLHSNYIGDSIIADGCSFGSGAVTANLRFDEGTIRSTVNGKRVHTGQSKLGIIMGRNCRVGINASFCPGVMVGPDAVVGPNVCLSDDLGPSMFAKPTVNYETVARLSACARAECSNQRGKQERP